MIPTPELLRRELFALIAGILAGAPGRGFAIAPWTLEGAPLWEALRAGPDAARPGPAERELLNVHRIELARLVRAAARERLRGAEPPRGGAGGLDLEGWRAALEEALACAARDRLWMERALFQRIALLRRGGPRDWPGAGELALASLRLWEEAEGRLVWARARLAEGAALEASVVLARELARRPAPARPGEWIAALARAQRECGATARARRLEAIAGS